jgi:endonuclease G, mitochondrial
MRITYQTNIANIEQLTGMKMPAAIDIYKDKRPVKLMLKEIDVTLESADTEGNDMGYAIEGLVL